MENKLSGCGIPKKVSFFGETYYYLKMCDGSKHLFNEREIEVSENRFKRAEEGASLIREVGE